MLSDLVLHSLHSWTRFLATPGCVIGSHRVGISGIFVALHATGVRKSLLPAEVRQMDRIPVRLIFSVRRHFSWHAVLCGLQSLPNVRQRLSPLRSLLHLVMKSALNGIWVSQRGQRVSCRDLSV